MTLRLLSWTGIDDPSRVDLASVDFGEGSMRAIGSTRARDFTSSWELEVAEGWVTRSLRVTTRGFGWVRSLELTRSDAGAWSSESSAHGGSHLPAPGLADPGALAGAVDCDLGLCPVTNTMPIRRLELMNRDVPSTRLVMAWVDMPSLRVVRSDQLYSSGAAGKRVLYASADGDITAELTVDEHGMVIDYPHLARRQHPSTPAVTEC